MSYDWVYNQVNELKPIIEEIKSTNDELKELTKELEKAKNEKKSEEIEELNKEKKQLEDKKNKLSEQLSKQLSKILDKYQYHETRLRLLSYYYSATKEKGEKIVREEYIDYISTIVDCEHGLKDKTPENILKVIDTIKKIDLESLIYLPLYSFILKIPFKLIKSFISKDDQEIYVIDNPIKKDKVFQVPFIPGSTWKGNLRWTAGKMLEQAGSSDEKISMRLKLVKLFGHENESEKSYFDSIFTDDELSQYEQELKNITTQDGLRQGRLHFYPTFFFRIGLEVINPHNRKTRAGTNPIYIECVPKDTCGDFILLYVPFDLMGKPIKIQRAELKDDLDLIIQALQDMMLKYGFSAKKSSGFGIIEPEFAEPGKFQIKEKPETLKSYDFENFDKLKNAIKEFFDQLEKENTHE